RSTSIKDWSNNYFWQSNTQSLSLSDSKLDHGKTLSWAVIDSATRRTQFLSSVHPADFLACFEAFCVPSPNGKWLLYDDGNGTMIATSLDGSKQSKWARPNPARSQHAWR